MSRMLPLLLCAALPLSACSPAATPPDAPAASAQPPPAAPAVPAVTAPVPTAPASSAPEAPAATGMPEPMVGGASISGAIRDGNRPPPALQVCAHPLDGGSPACTETAKGARDYRIEVAPGRYFLMGWVQGGELALIAHASQIRCIRAPCPPDELIEVAVAAGEHKTGVDLSGGYVDVPAGWPHAPG